MKYLTACLCFLREHESDPRDLSCALDLVFLPSRPSVAQVMDRQAITRHLLSDPQDPYNRKPLTVEMLEPNDALRNEIEEWIRSDSGQTRFSLRIFSVSVKSRWHTFVFAGVDLSGVLMVR